MLRHHAHHGIDNGLGLRVDFDIDNIALFPAAEQGARQSFWNQVDIEFRIGNVSYGQAATVQADKAFAQNIGLEFGRQWGLLLFKLYI